MFKVRLSMLALAGLSTLFACGACAVTFQEDFSSDPAGHGWKAFGNTNLFQWDSTSQNLRVTWDSTQTNSYYYHPLNNVLAIEDAFSVEFDIQLTNLVWNGQYPPQLAVGLFKYAEATDPGFSRPDGTTPDLFEFDYFPDDGSGHANIAASLVDMTVNATNEYDFYFIFDLLPMDYGVTYHVQLLHGANDPSISANVFTNGQLYSSMPQAYPATIVDFRLDTFSVSSYQSTYGASTLAQGMVDNVQVTMPPPPVQQVSGGFSGNAWQVQFAARTNWLYTLERTTDFQSWTDASPTTAGVSGVLTLSDTNAPAANAFYRVRAARP